MFSVKGTHQGSSASVGTPPRTSVNKAGTDDVLGGNSSLVDIERDLSELAKRHNLNMSPAVIKDGARNMQRLMGEAEREEDLRHTQSIASTTSSNDFYTVDSEVKVLDGSKKDETKTSRMIGGSLLIATMIVFVLILIALMALGLMLDLM